MRSAALLALLPAMALAQGQDSLPSERSLMIVAEVLPGHYVNTNQVYFDGRLRVAEGERHGPLSWRIARTDNPQRFSIAIGDTLEGAILLRVDAGRDELRMRIALSTGATCHYVWRREAAQFRADIAGPCRDPLPGTLVLSAEQLWVYPAPAVLPEPYRLHRARSFTCHADMPGVGGGRDIPYERYADLDLHDQGGAAWFTTRESVPRRLGISLLSVDWPINNYEGLYARDSLVVYVSEETGDERIEHGYAFTVPEADRIGINLKWLLAMCYRVPNAEAVPEL